MSVDNRVFQSSNIFVARVSADSSGFGEKQ